MSAFISMTTPAGVVVLSDGAINRDRILIDDRRKVVVTDSVAVTMRGRADVSFAVAERFCEYARQVGPAAAMDGVGDFAAQLRAEYGVLSGPDATEWLVAAYVPGRGGQHRFFQTEAITVRSTGVELAAYDVVSPGSLIIRGAVPPQSEIRERGLLPAADERLSGWGRRGGLGIMPVMRERPATAVGVDGIVSAIGGHVDITVITETGLVVECIHDWMDLVGRPIGALVA